MKKEVEWANESDWVATMDGVVEMEVIVQGRKVAQMLSLPIKYLKHTASRAVEGMRELALTYLPSRQLLVPLQDLILQGWS
jgi:hypothetical protein